MAVVERLDKGLFYEPGFFVCRIDGCGWEGIMVLQDTAHKHMQKSHAGLKHSLVLPQGDERGREGEDQDFTRIIRIMH